MRLTDWQMVGVAMEKSHKVIYDKIFYVLVVPRHSDPFLHALNPGTALKIYPNIFGLPIKCPQRQPSEAQELESEKMKI